MLEFCTVDLDDGVRVGKQNFRCSFDDPRFTRTRGPEKQHRPYRTRRVIHTGEVYLEQAAHPANSSFLPDDQTGQLVLKLSSPWALAFGVKQYAL